MSPRRRSTYASLAFASAALTLAFAEGASAGPVSETPVGYRPRTFIPGANASGSFDVSGAGFDVITISGQDAGNTVFDHRPATLTFSGPKGATIAGTQAGAVNFDATSSASPATTLPVASAQYVFISDTSGYSNFSTTPLYGETTFMQLGRLVIGYFEGTYSRETSTYPSYNIFTLLDYGIIATATPPVPEPATLALITTAVAATAAFRRRRISGRTHRKAFEKEPTHPHQEGRP